MLKKNVLSALLVILLPLILIFSVGANQVTPLLTMEGDELIIDTVSETSTLIGNVLATYEGMQLKSQKLVYDQKKQYAKLDGQVQLTGEMLQVLAQTIEVDLVKNLMTMTGNVEVMREGQLIKGTVVTYDLKTKTLKVKKARLEITESKK